jgi:drug/metabolite transporter (DMT)-like permease
MSKNMLSWVLLLALAGIWGSSFILIKRGMTAFDGTALFSDVQVASLRMSIAGLVLLPFSLRFLKKIKTIKQFLLLLTVGLSGNFLPSFLFTYAETELSSGYAGMLNSFTPIFSILIGAFVFKQKLTSIQFFATTIAVTGIVLLMIAGQDLSKSGTWWHILAIVLATLFYAISLNTIKYTLSNFKSIEITSLAFGIVFLPSLLIATATGSFTVLKTVPQAWEGFGFIVILGLVGTAFAVFIFNKLISISSVIFASSVTYFMPIVAVIMGLFIKEVITFYQIGAMLIILVGVFLANYYRLIFKK